MGVVNVYQGLESSREIFNFNGPLAENLFLNWEYTKILKGSEELTPDYSVQEDDVLLIHEYPGDPGTLIFIIGVIVLSGLWYIMYSNEKAKQVEKENKEALDKLRKKNNKPTKDDTIAWLSGGRNDKADNKQAPIILGRHFFSPYFISDPYLKPSGTDGKDLYWYATFLCGQTGLCFDKIRNGSTDLITFPSSSDATSGVFDFDNPGGDNPPFYDTKNSIEIVQGSETFTEPYFTEKWVDSLESSVEIGRKKKENGDDDGPDEVIRETAKFPMQIEVEIFVDGLAKYNSDGDEIPATLELQMQWSTDKELWQPMYNLDGWVSDGFWKYSLERKKTQQMRFIFYRSLPSSVYSKDGKPVYIKATRLNVMGNSGAKDRMYLNAVRTKLYNPDTSSNAGLIAAKNMNGDLAKNFCRMGIKMKVNKNTQDALDRFGIVASMTGRTWDSKLKKWSSNKTKTSNPAAVALEVLTGLIHKTSAFNDSDIDLASFGALYEYCKKPEVNIEGGGITKFELEANGVITGASKKLDVLNSIFKTCDAGLYVNEYGKLIAYYDDYQETPVALLNPQRIVKMSESRNLNRKTDGYKMEFVDAAADWANDSKRVLRPGVVKIAGVTTYTTLKFDYVTSYNHVMWLARRTMAKEILRPGETKVSVGKEGRYYRPGSLVKVQHEGFKIGIGSGEIVDIIVENNMVSGFRTMERFDLSKDRDYFIDYYVVTEDKNHVPEKRQIRSTGEYTDRLLFTVPIPLDSYDVPDIGNIVSVTDNEKHGTLQVREAKRYIVTDMSETAEGYDITLVQYNEEIYRTTSIDAIPSYQSSIISSNPKIFAEPETEPYDGAPGLTPEIGENGNWWIGGEDTGKKAEGTDAPAYRGATALPDLGNTGVVGGKVMRVGDYVMFTGVTQGVWIYGRIYQRTGENWIMLLPPTVSNRQNADKYLIATSDLTEGTPEAVFSRAQIGSIVTSALFAELVSALEIKLQQGGFISGNYSPGNSGFIIEANGNAEFNNGIFRGELAARYIKITGNVTSGTNYILRSNNTVTQLSPEGGWIASTYPAIIKEIKTLAKGSCLIRLKFPSVRPAPGGEKNLGNYKITVNDTIIIDWTSYSLDTDIDIANVSLPNDINYIFLYGAPQNAGNNSGFSVYNTKFELRCAQDPGFLAVLG